MSGLLDRHRWAWPEAMFWGAWIAVFFLFPDRLSLSTQILIWSMFALSLDLVMGFCGILSLGQAFFFGVGAYATAWTALLGWHEPISAALVGAAVAALAALPLGLLVLGLSGLRQIMATLAIGALGLEAANRAAGVTGGDDGLQGFGFAPLLGHFRWSIFGQTSFFYALTGLALVFLLLRHLLAAPFGITLQGIRDNATRMRMLGVRVGRYRLLAWTIGAAIAGLAGALGAQTTRFVGLDSMSLDASIAVLVMLVVGGTGRLYGGPIGAAVYMIVHDQAANWNPYHWMAAIGVLLILVVRLGRGGLLGLMEQAWARF